MLIRQYVIEGLGHLSTLIADETTGAAAVIDPRRDVDVYLDEAAARDLRISHVVETHLHNDYVSGGRELAARTGATHVIGAGAGLEYEHQPVRHGERFDVGRLRFVALETPGHTPEHVTYTVADRSRSDDSLLMFTGGSLLVGAVGRTDLLGAANAVPFGRAMFRSLQDVILPHEDYLTIYPTHGAGSLCSTGISSSPSSTLGYERRHNPMVKPREVELFLATLLGSQPAFPRYFSRMRPTNQGGPPLLGGIPTPQPLAVARVRELLADGALLVDARPPVDHALSHAPGSMSIPAGTSFGTWLGWVVEPDRPVVLVMGQPGDWDDLVRQSLRVGYDGAIVGHVQGGFDRWVRKGGDVESNGRLTVQQLASRLASGDSDTPLVLDVRQASEFASGHVPGSWHITAGDLPGRLEDLPRDRPIATICQTGNRSSIAASLLRRAGFEDVSWVATGLPTWRAAGYPIEKGEGRSDPDREAEAEAAPAHAHG